MTRIAEEDTASVTHMYPVKLVYNSNIQNRSIKNVQNNLIRAQNGTLSPKRGVTKARDGPNTSKGS